MLRDQSNTVFAISCHSLKGLQTYQVGIYPVKQDFLKRVSMQVAISSLISVLNITFIKISIDLVAYIARPEVTYYIFYTRDRKKDGLHPPALSFFKKNGDNAQEKQS